MAHRRSLWVIGFAMLSVIVIFNGVKDVAPASPDAMRS